jgi:threonine synthase
MDEDSSAKRAGQEVLEWYQSLKAKGGFGPIPDDILNNGRRTFESERVSNPQTLETMKSYYESLGYILDPHSAVAVTAAERSINRVRKKILHVSLSTAHPAKFAAAVELALKDKKGFNFEEEVLPSEFIGLLQKQERITTVGNSWEQVREIIKEQVKEYLLR